MNNDLEEQFVKIIESIGFEIDEIFSSFDSFRYGKYLFLLYIDYYYFYDGEKWYTEKIPYDDLDIIKKVFKKELRSIKLKTILCRNQNNTNYIL